MRFVQYLALNPHILGVVTLGRVQRDYRCEASCSIRVDVMYINYIRIRWAVDRV